MAGAGVMETQHDSVSSAAGLWSLEEGSSGDRKDVEVDARLTRRTTRWTPGGTENVSFFHVAQNHPQKE